MEQSDLRRQDMSSDNLHLVTENGEQCILWKNNQLTYIAQNRSEIPAILATKFGHLAQKLDLSYNTFTTFRYIDMFVNLNELILDNNSLDDDNIDFKPNLRLKTLSINKNKLKDLDRLIANIRSCYPNLEFLSLIGNPLCPSQMAMDSNSREDENNYAYMRYRFYVIYNLPNLSFLDSSKITNSEREEAMKKGYYLQLVKPDSDSYNLEFAPGTRLPVITTTMANQFDDLQPRGVFSRLAYRYTGKNSEGNRFIKNSDL